MVRHLPLGQTRTNRLMFVMLKTYAILVFGIRFTMQGHFYRDVFSKAGIDLIVPEVNEQAYMHDIYMNELVSCN